MKGKLKMKNFKESTKENEGITLIALVITIIVLLILAGVSLSMVFNSNGLFSRAQNTAKKWNEASQNEADYLTEVERLYDKYTGGGSGGEAGTRKADYADLDGDGVADGVIYADLTKGKSGGWAGVDVEQLIELLVQEGMDREEAKREAEGYKEEAKQKQKKTYTIPTVTSGLKEYEVVKTDYVGDFGTGNLIRQKAGTTGLDRYYIMALKDEELPNGMDVNMEEVGINKNFKTAYWYYNAYGRMTDYGTFTSENFGEGKNNTKKMVARWRANGTVTESDANYGDGKAEDIWGQIGAPTNLEDIVWFVPSRGEVCAFGDEFGITTANYFNKFKLAPTYWTSSQGTNYGAYLMYLWDGDVDWWDVNCGNSIRLSATF